MSELCPHGDLPPECWTCADMDASNCHEWDHGEIAATRACVLLGCIGASVQAGLSHRIAESLLEVRSRNRVRYAARWKALARRLMNTPGGYHRHTVEQEDAARAAWSALAAYDQEADRG